MIIDKGIFQKHCQNRTGIKESSSESEADSENENKDDELVGNFIAT